MIRLIIWILFAVAGAVLAVFAISEQGYVALRWSGWVVETSVSFLALLLVLALAVAFGVVRTLNYILSWPARWVRWRESRKAALPMKHLAQGMQALALQEHDKALTAFAAGKDASQWLRLLLAAQMAHAQHQFLSRDQLIEKALALASDQAFTIQLLHIQWLLEDDPTRALSLIELLQEQHPKQRTLKTLRIQVLEKLQDWTGLEASLVDAKSVLSRASFAQLQLRIQANLLLQAVDRDLLEQRWRALSGSQQKNAILVHAYVDRALAWGQSKTLWPMVAKSLDYHWDNRLLPLLARIHGQDPYQELRQVQAWKKQHSQESQLWWISGLLAQFQGMREQAEQDFKQSLALRPDIAVAISLSNLYADLSQNEQGRLVLCDQWNKVTTSTTNRFHPFPQIQQAG